MAAVKYDFKIEKGTTFELKLVFKDCDGVLIDLTGSIFTSQIRANAISSAIIGTFTCTVSNQITNQGEIVMSLTKTQTSALPSAPQSGPQKVLASYSYDLEQDDGTGSVSRIIEGVVEVSPETTR